MTVLSQFWLTLIEAIYLPIFQFYGYSSVLTFVFLIFFFALQIWIFWHLFLKPFVYVLKLLLNLICRNTLWKEVEVDEKKTK